MSNKHIQKHIKKHSPQPNNTSNTTKQTRTSDVSDSSIVCHNELEINVGFSGVRKHTSIRCDSKLWESFKKVCKNNGLSTCDVLEKLILGFVVGYSTRVAQPTTIYVTVDAPRVVKRVRRRQLVFEDEVVVCEARGCRRPAEFRFYHCNGNVYNLCGKHVEEYREFAVKVEPLGSGDSE